MRIRGTVKWFNDTKGYGFLRRDDGQSDCFVHHSDIQGEGYRSLQEGEKVEFDVIQQPKGPKASNVVKVADTGDTDEAPAAAPEPAPSQPAEAPVATFGSVFGEAEPQGAEGGSEEE
jgi:CspA family cold shock protein